MISNWPDNIYILIPAYNTCKLLEKFIPALIDKVPSGRICIVNDASEDNIHIVCEKWNITCLDHHENMGKGAALKTGFEHLIKKGARWIITMDADGQHAVEDIPKFIDAAQKNPSSGIIIGARSMKIGIMPVMRICSNKITSFILSIFSHTRIKDSQCGYRIYSTDLLKRINLEYSRFQMESEIILKAVFNNFMVLFTDVQTLYFNKQSHICHFKDTLRWIAAVVRIWFQLVSSSRDNKKGDFSGNKNEY
ncbi:MAG TPA: glycosyltransferase family 2 protein [Chitinispirillaceae bacterium]|jgi:glycosyltransferase involved in cell wall biosynthesis|nr:glycosyltransferase family 2 protein [Chitinispirillaceae bacterium]